MCLRCTAGSASTGAAKWKPDERGRNNGRVVDYPERYWGDLVGVYPHQGWILRPETEAALQDKLKPPAGRKRTACEKGKSGNDFRYGL